MVRRESEGGGGDYDEDDVGNSDVTISKFRFSIDFDSIFSPKSRFRFDSSYAHAKSFPTKQNSVTTDAGRSSSK